jgi:glutathione synthase/RimK-type ligase-like ATP-grasp enzyme
VALATAAEFPDLDDDGASLIAALAAEGIDGVPAVWTDGSIDWAAFDLVVVRSTWDYPARVEQFRAWIDQVEGVTRLANPSALLRWNMDKRYLTTLAAADVPVVPSGFAEPGEHVEIPDGEVVVKPVVGAGSVGAARFAAGQRADAAEHARQLHADGRTVMVQPYVASVDTGGETALIHLGGAFSHAINKGPLLQVGAAPVEGLFRQETIEAVTPTAAELEVAGRVLAAVPGAHEPLYARVDVVDDAAGNPVLLELELCEPSLFLGFGPGSPERLAKATAVLLDRG